MATITGDQDPMAPNFPNDNLIGTSDADVISGLTGNDTISGLAGNDQLNGGSGDDSIDGGLGDDLIQVNEADEGNDTYHGGDGNDTIFALFGTDQVFGDAGDDHISVSVITSPHAGETWDGGTGFDVLTIELGRQPGVFTYTVDLTGTTIQNFESFQIGGSGLFPIASFDYTLQMTAAQFNQFSDGFFFPTSLKHIVQITDGGSIASPARFGNAENILLSGQADTFDGSGILSGVVTVDCGAGADVFDAPTGSTSTAILTVHMGSGDDTLFAGLTALTGYGDDGNDHMIGDALSDHLEGGAGNDVLTGLEGPDILVGGTGADMVDGGAGDDLIRISGSDGIGDQISGGEGTDHIQVTGSAPVTLDAFDALSSSIEFWDGNGKGLFGTPGADLLSLVGMSGVSFLPFVDGQGGSDILNGSNVGDVLRGGGGRDTLTGVLGGDTLTGGQGADRFVLVNPSDSPKGPGRDVITDFSHIQHDKIVLTEIDADTSANAGNDVFKFIFGQSFHGGGGEVRFAHGLVQGDVNGDKVADFEIKLTGVTHLSALDFKL